MARIRLQRRVLYEGIKYDGNVQELEEILQGSGLEARKDGNVVKVFYPDSPYETAIMEGDCVIIKDGMPVLVNDTRILGWDKLWRAQDKDYYLEMKE